MAGSLNHIVGTDGQFKMGTIENLGDAHEALDECFKIILELSGGDMSKVSAACRKHRLPDPFSGDDAKPAMRRGGSDAL